MTKEKVFSKYIMSYESNENGLMIISLMDSSHKEAMFSHTFYKNNKDYLDNFINIKEFVKPKKETQKKHYIVISLDDFSIGYNDNSKKISEEDLKMAMSIVKNEMANANPLIAKKKALLIKYNNDIKTLEALGSDDFEFEDEIEEITKKAAELRKEIEELLEA